MTYKFHYHSTIFNSQSSIQNNISSNRQSIINQTFPKTTNLITNFFSHLSGSVFSKDSSLIHVVDNAMNSSKTLLEKPTVVLILPAVQLLCVAMALPGQLIRSITGGVSFEVNNKVLSHIVSEFHFHYLSPQQLNNIIDRINQLRSRHQSYSVCRKIRSINKQENNEKIEDEVDDKSTTRGDSSEGETFFDCRETSDCYGKSSDNFSLKIASFGCVFLVYLQFSFLLYLIGLTQIKAGFIFLLVCAFCISSLVLKVSFDGGLR
jgi:hypothetical protein